MNIFSISVIRLISLIFRSIFSQNSHDLGIIRHVAYKTVLLVYANVLMGKKFGTNLCEKTEKIAKQALVSTFSYCNGIYTIRIAPKI